MDNMPHTAATRLRCHHTLHFSITHHPLQPTHELYVNSPSQTTLHHCQIAQTTATSRSMHTYTAPRSLKPPSIPRPTKLSNRIPTRQERLAPSYVTKQSIASHRRCYAYECPTAYSRRTGGASPSPHPAQLCARHLLR